MAAGTDLSSPWAATAPGPAPRRAFAPPLDPPPRSALGGWWRRFAGYLVDGLVGLLVLAPALALTALALAVSDGLAVLVGSLAYVAIIVFYVDQMLRQGRTGATLGKLAVGLRVVQADTGRPTGWPLGLVRPFAHILDALPLYLGFLLPVVDRKRQTFADKVLGTVVVKAPPLRPPLPVLGLVLALATLMTIGSVYAIDESAPAVREAFEEGAADPAADPGGEPGVGAIVPPPSFTPALPQQVGPLPADDVEGRIAPVAAGYAAVPDDEAELGALTVADTAALSATTPEEAAQNEEALTSFGLQSAFGRGFEGTQNIYTTVVYRFGDPASAAAFVESIGAGLGNTTAGTVPGSLVYGGTGLDSLAGVFAYGSFVYELTVFGEPGTYGDVDRRVLLERQYDHAVRTG